MIEIKETTKGTTIVITKPLVFDVKSIADAVRQDLLYSLEDEYGDEEIANIDYSDYKTLFNRILEEAKID